MATGIVLSQNMDSLGMDTERVGSGTPELSPEKESFTNVSPALDHPNDSEEEDNIQFRKKKRVIASDSEDGDETSEPMKTVHLSDKSDDSEIEGESKPLNKSKGRIIMNDDDDDDSSVASEAENKTGQDDKESPSSAKASKKKVVNKNTASDSDDDLPSIGSTRSRGRGAAESDADVPASYVDVFKNSDVFAAESSSDEERKPYEKVRNDSDSDKSLKNSKNAKQLKPRKPRKAKPVSKKQREKELAEITSRTQKMLRESNVSLPYHRPRQLTLIEFLKKRNDAKVPILNTIIKSSNIKSLGGKIVLPDTTNVISVEAEVEESLEVISPTKEKELSKVNEESPGCDLNDIPNPVDVDPVQEWLETVTPDNVDDLKDDLDMELQDPDLVVENSVKQKQSIDTEEVKGNEEITLSNQDDKLLTDIEIKETTEEKMEVILDVKTDNEKIDLEKEEINCKETNEKVGDKVGEEVNMETDMNEVEVEREVKENSTGNATVNLDSITENKNTVVTPVTLDTLETGNFAAQQADLDAYLESMKPKPKKLTIAERLKQLPGFSNLKPKIGKNNDSGKGVIDLNSKCKVDSRHKNIQTLMDRFVHHSSVVKPSKEQHFKVHVVKKEEDSQGMEHVTVDEVDYIKMVNSDEEEEKSGSPTQIPGSKMVRLQERLKQKIYAQKAKEFQEKLRLHAMYAEEKQLEDKCTDYDPLPENEEELDEISDSESEIDEDEEEELEELLSGTPKDKRRKRHVYVDDEAEDSDDDGDADNEEQDDESDDDDEDKDENECNDANRKAEGEDFVDGDFDHYFPISDTLPSAQPQIEKKALTEAAYNSSVKINLQRLDMTSQNERTTPSDLWLRPAPRCPLRMTVELEKGNETSDSAVNQLSEMEEEASQESSLPASECKSPIPSTVADLVEVVGDSNGQHAEDILAVCSGAFPSQQPATPEESQNCFGFDDDDDLLLGTLDETGKQLVVETPKVPENNSNSVLNNETPKMVERVSTTKRLIFNQNSEETTDTPKLSEKVSKTRLFSSDCANDGLENYDSDDNESVIGSRAVKKRKRLEFSDEEDDDNDTHEGEEENIPENDEEEEGPEESENIVGDDEEMAMEVEARTVKPKRGLFGKNGMLRKAFIEAEAELSGSEAGSEDEDERGLDRMEIEEGDEEIIDEDEVREKVGRAHLKALLDQDDEEIQYIQNKLLQDGDLHMDAGRERNFKWNYMQYDLNDDGANMGDMGDDTPIDEEEVKRQIEKAEKNKWIKENSQLFEDSQQESQKSLLENTTFLRLGKASLKKFTSFSESSSFQGCDVGDTSIAFTSFSRLLTGQVKNSLANNTEKKSDEAALCKATSQPLFASPDEPITKLRRGSFLTRGAPTLSRLAEMTKISDSVSNVKSNSKNFVFTVVTPPTAEEESKSKKALRRNQSLKSNPKKMLKIDRSFSSLDDSSKEASIFKWM